MLTRIYNSVIEIKWTRNGFLVALTTINGHALDLVETQVWVQNGNSFKMTVGCLLHFYS